MKLWHGTLSLFAIILLLTGAGISTARWQRLSAYWIAYVSAEDGQVYRMWEDGTNPHRLTNTAGRKMHLAAAPDGSHLVYVANPNRQDDFYLLDLASGAESPLTQDSTFQGEPDWSADGEWLLYYESLPIGTTDLYKMHLDGSQRQAVTRDYAFQASPLWVADGIIYLTRQDDGSTHLVYQQAGQTTHLTTYTGFNGQPALSPDGAWVVYVSDRDGDYHLYRMPLATGDLASVPLLSTPLPGGNYSPHWSPDGEWIVFYNGGHGNFQIYRVRPDGSDLQALTKRGAFLAPIWLPHVDLPWRAGWLGVGAVALLGYVLARTLKPPT